jgi:peptidoglycan/LPS O-acetylase OafA/YrhL
MLAKRCLLAPDFVTAAAESFRWRIRSANTLWLLKPRAPPSYNIRDDFIDVLRGLAISFVIILHSLGPAQIKPIEWGNGLVPAFDISITSLLLVPATFGWCGVAVFFAISGYCIHNSYSRERHLGVGRYLIKRTFRIYPPYVVSLLIFALWIAVSGGMPEYGTTTAEPRNVLAHALLIHNFSFTYFYGINPSYWSIAVEFQLYVLYVPLILWIDRFGWRRVMIFALLSEIGTRSLEAYYFMKYNDIPIHLVGVPLGFIFSWLVGAFVAELCRNNDKRYLVKKWHITVLITISIGSAFCKPASQFSFMLFSTSSAAIIMYLHQNNVHIVNWMRWFGALGLVSYSVYLIHQPLVRLVPKVYHVLGVKPPHVVVFVTCIMSVVPLFWCAWIMRRMVELPSVAVGNRLLARMSLGGRHPDVAGLIAESAIVAADPEPGQPLQLAS